MITGRTNTSRNVSIRCSFRIQLPIIDSSHWGTIPGARRFGSQSNYRVWHTRPGVGPPKLLLDGTEDSFLEELTGARVSGDDVLFEYAVSGIPPGDRLAEIKHYLYREGKLERVKPVALTPRDFVEFWLARPWSETAAWTDKSSRLKLQAWRQQHQGGFDWFFEDPTLQCKAHPDLWQVALPEPTKPNCTVADPDADQPLYLFPYSLR
jgi:hypothetical protein